MVVFNHRGSDRNHQILGKVFALLSVGFRFCNAFRGDQFNHNICGSY